MKLNIEQEAQIETIAQAAARLREAKATAHESARRRVEAEIRSFEIEVQKAVARGEAMGISYSQLAKRGMGMQNGTTAKIAAQEGRKFIDFEAEQAVEEALAEAPQATPRYAYYPSTDTLLVTFEPEEFAGKIDGITTTQALTFSVDGITLIPEDNQWNHPVARLVLSADGRKEALAFIEQATE